MSSNPKLSLISASPSPYARKVRIALAEKCIAFDLQTEVPWDSTTKTPRHNPLEKLPVLVVPNSHAVLQTANGKEQTALADGDSTPIYESHFILEWIETKFPDRPLLPTDPDLKLTAKQVEVVADGICDALVLRLFEIRRENQSPEWLARQERKINGGIRWLNDKVRASHADGGEKFLIGSSFGVADIAVGCVLGYMDVRAKHIDWKIEYPALKTYFDGLMRRESFGSTVPYTQDIQDKVV